MAERRKKTGHKSSEGGRGKGRADDNIELEQRTERESSELGSLMTVSDTFSTAANQGEPHNDHSLPGWGRQMELDPRIGSAQGAKPKSRSTTAQTGRRAVSPTGSTSGEAAGPSGWGAEEEITPPKTPRKGRATTSSAPKSDMKSKSTRAGQERRQESRPDRHPRAKTTHGQSRDRLTRVPEDAEDQEGESCCGCRTQ